MSQNSDVVIDRSKSQWSDLWRKEDYWAIWVGFFCMAVAICLVFSNRSTVEDKYKEYGAIIAAEAQKPIKTIEWYNATADQKKVAGNSSIDSVKSLISWLGGPGRWSSNPLDSLYQSQAAADAKNASKMDSVNQAQNAAKEALEAAQAAQGAAAAANFEDSSLNEAATAAIDSWQTAQSAASKASGSLAKPYNRIPKLIGLGIGLGIILSVGAAFMGFNVIRFFIAFCCVYLLCILASILGNQSTLRTYGLNAEVMSIALGMIIANTIGTGQLLKDGSQVEYYIKSGLVLLGAEVLFGKIIAIGIPGIFVAWVVTPIVLISTYIFGQKVLKMPSKSLNIVISADMSVCGTSAAIATAAAARAKKEELTLAIGLSLTFTAIMMVALPAFIRAVGMPEILGGAWIGGTVDSTGAVAAAGAWLGPKALQVAATVKMIQNVLIGITAFCVALYWTTKVEHTGEGKVGLGEIWNRFPKFVIGFLCVSIVMSIVSASLGNPWSSMLVDKGTNSISVPLRGWFFNLAFIAIGLTTDFRVLGKYFKGGKPIILYVCGQSLNLCLTLLMAWVMFYKVFPETLSKI